MTLLGMKRLALALLLAMLLVVAGCAAFQHALPWLAWVRAFAEAAAVGALADWFAVTALFRHPFGLPLPHTAIIPRRKDEIGAALGQFVEENFLTPDHVIARLAREHLARSAADWLRDPAHRETVSRTTRAAAAWALDRLDEAEARRVLDALLARGLRRLDAARTTGDLLELLVAHRGHEALLQHALPVLDEWLQANREMVRHHVRARSRLMPGFVDDWIANRFVDGMLALLHAAAADPAHPLRQQLDLAAREAVRALKHSPRWRRRGQALVRWAVGVAQREAWVGGLWNDLRMRVRKDLESPQSVIGAHLDEGLHAVARTVLADEQIQATLDRWTLQAAEAVLLRHRHHVGRLISEVVRQWDPDEVTRKIEAQIGRDLQYIRINGTVVGGLAGLALHGVTVLLGP